MQISCIGRSTDMVANHLWMGLKMTVQEKIDVFLSTGPFAVVGASGDRAKFGNKVLRCYLQHGLKAYPVNPRESAIEGVDCYANVQSLPEPVHGVSVITPPSVTEQIVADVAEAGVRHLWMQPGAESSEAISRAEALGLSVIAGGPCLLVQLGFRG